jgi:hypothetical protein
MKVLNRLGATDIIASKLSPSVLYVAVLFFSGACFLPGIVMTDTMARWVGAYTIVGKLDIPWGLELWLAPTMTWLMVPFAATKHGAQYLLAAQIAYLMLGGLAWIYFSSCRRPWWVAVVFMIPLVFAYASFIVPDVWTLAAILAIVGCFYALENSWRTVPFILLLFSSVVLFGFRQNSLVLVPFVWFFIVRLQGPSKLVKAGMVALTIVALSIIQWVPSIMGFAGQDSSASAPAWELAGAIKVARESGVALDSTFTLEGIADTDLVMKQHSFVTIDTLIWGASAAIPTTTIMQKAMEIKARWLKMIFNHPIIYLKTKLRIYGCMLGLCEDYLQTQIACVTPWPQLDGHLKTCASTGYGSKILEVINRIQGTLRVLLLPIFWLPVSAVVMLLSWRVYSRYDRMLIVLVAAYLGSFFILNQAASFRYLLPTYVVFTAYQIRFLLSLFLPASVPARASLG